MGHFHSTELQERFTECYATQEHLPEITTQDILQIFENKDITPKQARIIIYEYPILANTIPLFS